MFRNFFKNEKGGAMLMAIMGLAIISVFTAVAIFMGSSNARQTQTEGKRTQAYYVADAGIQTFLQELQKDFEADELVLKLEELSTKGKIHGTYEDMEFYIEVTEKEENKYEIRSTGDVDGTKDGTRVDITLEEVEAEVGGGGLKMGDGVIYITSTGNDTFQFQNLNQFKGTDISIYTMNKSVTQINDEPSESGYKKTSSNENGLVKDIFVKKDHTVEMVYNLHKKMVLKKYSNEELPDDSLKGKALDKVLSNTYFLPITDAEDYDAFLKDSAVFPLAKYKVPIGEEETKMSLDGKGTIDLKEHRYVNVAKKLEINGKLDMKTSGDLDIVLQKGFHIDKGSKFNIHADGRVNVYLEGVTDTDGGDIEVISEGPNSQVNFYVGNKIPFQTQDATKVLGVNLYAPTSDVQFQEKTRWEGLVVANQLQFNDNTQFRAPSAGSAESDMNKEKVWAIDIDSIEWKEWQR